MDKDKVFTSIFHEEQIKVPKYNPQDAKINVSVSISQKNYPRLKSLIDSEKRYDAKKAVDTAKSEMEARKAANNPSNFKESSSLFLDSIKMI